MITKTPSFRTWGLMIFLCLPPAWSSAQEKHLTSDFNLSKDVVNHETAVYQANGGNGKQEQSRSLEFQNGKLAHRVVKYTDATKMIFNTDESFSYDASGKLIRIESKIRYPSQYIYDKKGRLAQIKQGSKGDLIVEDFNYDTKGNPTKVVKKNGEFVEYEKTFQDYKDPSNHTCKIRKYMYRKRELSSTEIIQVKDGNKITSQLTDAENGKVTSTRYEYDEHRNLVKSESSSGRVFQSFFGYDVKGNAIKERSGEIGDSTYQFSKITYRDGTSSGSTDFAPYFSSGLQMPLLLMPMNQAPKDKYEVRKTGVKDFEVRNAKGEQVSQKPSEGLMLEGRDFMFYDAKTKEVSVLFGLFTDEYKPNQWHALITYNSPTGKYIVVNKDWDFFVIEKGKAADTAGLKLHKGIDEKTLVIAENGREKYFVPHMDQIKPFIMYPLESIAR